VSAQPVPAALVRLVAGTAQVGAMEQAFVFLTVDDDGFPHLALLSRTELEADPHLVRVVLAGRTGPANLRARPTATLLAVDGETVHVCKLRARRWVEHEGATAVELALEDHRADSLGIPLEPLRYRVTDDLPTSERWDRTAEVLRRLAK
jgi:hypothetical protein